MNSESSRRLALGVAVWGLRLAGLAAAPLWCVPARSYEVTDTTERTYFGFGYPDHWLASDVTLSVAPVTLSADGHVVPTKLDPRGPQTVWLTDPYSRRLGRGFTYSSWRRTNPLYGPLWQTGLAAIAWVVAAYLNQFRRPARREVTRLPPLRP